MTIELFSRAVLLCDLPEEGLRAGDVVTVVDTHVDSDGKTIGYEVEVFAASGETIAVTSVPADALRLPTPSDRLTSRVA